MRMIRCPTNNAVEALLIVQSLRVDFKFKFQNIQMIAPNLNSVSLLNKSAQHGANGLLSHFVFGTTKLVKPVFFIAKLRGIINITIMLSKYDFRMHDKYHINTINSSLFGSPEIGRNLNIC